MRLLKGIQAVRRPPTRAVVTVGVFDGVHLAHQRLLRATVRLARRMKGTSVAITFDPDPQRIVDPAHAQPSLMPLEARVAALRSLGVQWTWIIPFTKRFSRMTSEQFIQRILIRRLRAAAVIVGETFAFGRNRQGDMGILQAIGPSCGMRVLPLTEVRRGGAPVSSSRIRRLIRDGALAQARHLLGRPPELYGVVVRGTGRGRRLGFRTANLRLTSHVLPPQGVYAVCVHRRDHRRVWPGVTPPPITVRGKRTVAGCNFAFGELIGGGVMNLGIRPTFGPGPMVCEVHLLGFSGTLLGQAVSVSVLARLRGERRFSSGDALRRQVRRDITRARTIVARHPQFVRR
jgi:riboflavin kinase/FMN adenylyltransferase